MSYKIVWYPKARKRLGKLELSIAQDIILKVGSITENPKHFLEELKGVKSYKLRIGDYRAIIDLDESKGIIQVILVGHRSTVYKKLKKIIRFLKK
jgi:mRNA interferase RelE/StbE